MQNPAITLTMQYSNLPFSCSKPFSETMVLCTSSSLSDHSTYCSLINDLLLQRHFSAGFVLLFCCFSFLQTKQKQNFVFMIPSMSIFDINNTYLYMLNYNLSTANSIGIYIHFYSIH